MAFFKIHTHSPAETEAVAARIAGVCQIGDCIALKGDLGAGKTVFARGFIRALAGNVEVTSPTFNLAQCYDTAYATVWHFDLYRIARESELAELGLEEAFCQGITLIEWPQVAASYLPGFELRITIMQNLMKNERLLLVEAPPAWYERLTGILA